jgi:hypothetical protein
VVSAASDRDFEAAFASVVQHRAGALLIGQDPFLFQAGGQLVALAARVAPFIASTLNIPKRKSALGTQS